MLKTIKKTCHESNKFTRVTLCAVNFRVQAALTVVRGELLERSNILRYFKAPPETCYVAVWNDSITFTL